MGFFDGINSAYNQRLIIQAQIDVLKGIFDPILLDIAYNTPFSETERKRIGKAILTKMNELGTKLNQVK